MDESTGHQEEQGSSSEGRLWMGRGTQWSPRLHRAGLQRSGLANSEAQSCQVENKTKQHTTAWVRWGCSLATAKRSVFCVALCLEASASTHSSQRKHLCLGRQREGRGWVGQAFTHLALGCHLLANRLL